MLQLEHREFNVCALNILSHIHMCKMAVGLIGYCILFLIGQFGSHGDRHVTNEWVNDIMKIR